MCKPCAETRLISADDLPPGTAIGTGVTLIDLAAESKVFTFSFPEKDAGRGLRQAVVCRLPADPGAQPGAWMQGRSFRAPSPRWSGGFL